MGYSGGEVPRRQLETQAWNSVESSGQDKERGWESLEYKKTQKLRVQMRLSEQLTEKRQETKVMRVPAYL